MSKEQLPEDIAKWARWFAVETNNRAWQLAEKSSRSALEDEEMLHAAHASAFHWRRIGTELHQARADLLLAQVHALLGHGPFALTHARRSHAFFGSHESPDWELAFAEVILAHAAFAAGDAPLHARHYTLAKARGAAISTTEDREIFERTFRQVPAPEATT